MGTVENRTPTLPQKRLSFWWGGPESRFSYLFFVPLQGCCWSIFWLHADSSDRNSSVTLVTDSQRWTGWMLISLKRVEYQKTVAKRDRAGLDCKLPTLFVLLVVHFGRVVCFTCSILLIYVASPALGCCCQKVVDKLMMTPPQSANIVRVCDVTIGKSR